MNHLLWMSCSCQKVMSCSSFIYLHLSHSFAGNLNFVLRFSIFLLLLLFKYVSLQYLSLFLYNALSFHLTNFCRTLFHCFCFYKSVFIISFPLPWFCSMFIPLGHHCSFIPFLFYFYACIMGEVQSKISKCVVVSLVQVCSSMVFCDRE